MLGWRLVSVLVLAYLLLGEQLQTIWQFVGALIVLATITWYVRRQPR
jgi:drug/metabolite transporter (DMT)-like permease